MAQNQESPRVVAIIPAAGRSRRMGTPRPLAPIGARTMLECVIEPLESAGLTEIVVVANTQLATLLPVEVSARASIAINEDATSEMIDSVRIGLADWQRRTALSDGDGILVCPADHPSISTADVAACVAAFRSTPNRIIIAAYGGRRGHPLIFPVSLAAFVHSAACDAGLNLFARSHEDRVWLVACESDSVVHDVDTPDDMQRAQARI